MYINQKIYLKINKISVKNLIQTVEKYGLNFTREDISSFDFDFDNLIEELQFSNIIKFENNNITVNKEYINIEITKKKKHIIKIGKNLSLKAFDVLRQAICIYDENFTYTELLAIKNCNHDLIQELDKSKIILKRNQYLYYFNQKMIIES